MKRSAVTLLAASVLLLPALSAVEHTDRQLGPTLEGREITVTGHDERDRSLHIEAAAGIVQAECPECVLDKRQSGAEERAEPAPEFGLADGRPAREMPALRNLESSASGPPRAPPLV